MPGYHSQNQRFYNSHQKCIDFLSYNSVMHWDCTARRPLENETANLSQQKIWSNIFQRSLKIHLPYCKLNT